MVGSTIVSLFDLCFPESAPKKITCVFLGYMFFVVKTILAYNETYGSKTRFLNLGETLEVQTLRKFITSSRHPTDCNGYLVLSSWANKVRDIGQQALLGADCVEESESRKCFESTPTPGSARILGWGLPLLTHLVSQLQEPCQRPG